MKLESIEQIRKQVVSCTKCELCKTRKNAVPGKGNKNSDIIFIGEAPGKGNKNSDLVFIGEAPGRSEDKAGEPFVGAAGKKLSAALEDSGLSRDSVYITNVVKCRPPNNRVPSIQEKESCKNYLDSELELIKPKIICVMGNTAFNSLLGGNNILQNRGKLLKKDGKLYFITIHPAATIYNQSLIQELKKDMKTLVKTLAEIKK